MANTNVRLSQNELATVTNTDFLLTKHTIISKVYTLFGLLTDEYIKQTKAAEKFLPAEVLSASPKIYKGEQYEKLPYVMMDYPRFFNKEEVFAIRGFFWWGNFFSITLHISGKYQQMFAGNIFNWMEKHKTDEWFLCINIDEWKHNFNADNYQPLSSFFPNKIGEDNLRNLAFLKLAKKLSFENWDDAIDFFRIHYGLLLEIFQDQFPNR